MQAPTLEPILVDVTDAGYGEAKGRATGTVKQEGRVVREGRARLVHEDVDGTPYLLFPLKVVGSTHQEVLPPAQEKSGSESVRLPPPYTTRLSLNEQDRARAMQMSKRPA